MKVIITGASGFIGNHISRLFIQSDIKVLALGRNTPNNLDIQHIKFDLTTPDFEVINGITDVDTLVHCSAVMAESSNLESFDPLYANLKMSESITSLCRRLKIKQLINISSIAVYPNIDGHYDEHSITCVSDNNDAMYGLSKLCAENLFSFLLKNRHNINVVHLRTSQVFGDGMRTDRTYHLMKEELHSKNTITVFSNGERVSNFVSVAKVASVVKFFMEHRQYEGIYNLGGDNITYLNLAKALITQFGNVDSKIILIDKGIKSKFYLNTEKLDQLIKAHN